MPSEARIVAVTGANGFIGRNLIIRLRERSFDVRALTRDTSPGETRRSIREAAIIFHLAGANRPAEPEHFMRDNRDYTISLGRLIREEGGTPLLIHASSVKAVDDSPYGRSKRAAERELLSLAMLGVAQVAIYRLPNIFGKWARPDYNSAVATFCFNIARDLPIRIDDPGAQLVLMHVDDLIDQWLSLLDNPLRESGFIDPHDLHVTTVGELVALVQEFASKRRAGEILAVGSGFQRALYSTFIAALPRQAFSYSLAARADPRGSFTEILKTPESGQFSVFNAYPGVTRGGHYHHAKVEKFLVVHGTAKFRFRRIESDEYHEILVSAETPTVVETIPGWTHDVTNIGDDLMVSLVWANEVFDPKRPDTVPMPV